MSFPLEDVVRVAEFAQTPLNSRNQLKNSDDMKGRGR